MRAQAKSGASGQSLGRLLLIALAALIFLTAFLAAPAAALNGTGTETDPYLIETSADLKAIVSQDNYLSAHYRLETDINLGVED